MISKKTVLILGAGASKPYGLPLGMELRDIVIKNGYAYSVSKYILDISRSHSELSL